MCSVQCAVCSVQYLQGAGREAGRSAVAGAEWGSAWRSNVQLVHLTKKYLEVQDRTMYIVQYLEPLQRMVLASYSSWLTAVFLLHILCCFT